MPARLALLFSLLFSLPALADTPKTLAEDVRERTVTGAAAGATGNLAPERVSVSADVGTAEDVPAEESEAAESADLLETVDAPRDARTAFEQALAWAQDGVKQHRKGEWLAASKNLHDARIALLEAGLPEALQERGLSVLDCALGSELGRVDLEALAEELEQFQLEKDGATLEERDYIEREARRILAAFGDTQPKPADLEVFVDEVHDYIEYYQDKQREFYERSYLRKHKYWPTIREVFTAKKIPLEQGYMALVESGFNPLARSRANARGLWQFIPGTGRRYGLDRSEDFYDIQKSTEAAAEYLLDLIGIFGSDSFLLATASYNAGEGRIMGCLRHLNDPFGGRSFWEIRGCLARETREYVPRILAAAIIGKDPKRFGFDLPSEEELARQYDIVVVPHPTSLSFIAAQAGITVADLRAANSDLAPQASRTPVRHFPLYVPAGSGAATQQALVAKGPDPVVVAEREVPVGTSGGGLYHVRRGDTLSAIAGRHGVSVAALARANQLRSPYRLKIGQSLMIPGEGKSPAARKPEAAPAQTAKDREPEAARTNNKTKLIYTVQAGNSLEEIAVLFAVQYRDLLTWNNLRSRSVKKGQKLVVYPRRPWYLKEHTVKRGETPGEIARRYGVTTDALLTANGLGRRTVIYPGSKLRVYVRG